MGEHDHNDDNHRPIIPQVVEMTKTSSVHRYCGTKRWQLAYIIFFGVFCLYSLRVNLSVAVVCMVNNTDASNNDSSINDNIGVGSVMSGYKNEFFWSKSTTSNLLSSYFYGYIVLQLPGGWAAGRFGASRLLTVSMLMSSLVTLVIPVCARLGLVWIYGARIVLGLCAGVTYPAFQSMWGRWAPPQERTKLASIAYSGGYLGTIVSFGMSGYLCDHGFAGGWPSIFYITGGAALVWTVVWYLLVYDSPSKHPTISQGEREYIVSSLGEQTQEALSIPWRGMMTSSPFWALIMAIVAVAWVDYTFLTSLPQYMKDVLDYDIEKDGILSSVPSMCQFVSSLACGQVADWMRGKGLSTRLVRNIFQVTVFLGIAGCLLGVGYVDRDHRTTAIALLGMSGFFAGLQQAGYIANFIDIAPRFSGIMYGIGNCVATIPGIISPTIVGIMTQQKSREEWQSVFDVCVGMSLLAGLVFLVFSRGDVQPWAVGTPPPEQGGDGSGSGGGGGGGGRVDDVDEDRSRDVQVEDEIGKGVVNRGMS